MRRPKFKFPSRASKDHSCQQQLNDQSPTPMDNTKPEATPTNLTGPALQSLMSRVSDDDFFRLILSAGYHFHPTDVELVAEYLMRKINGLDLPRNRIHEVELYSFHPAHLAGSYIPCEENEWYFFTQRNIEYREGRRLYRAAGEGFWKATSADKPIIHNNEIIGYRRALTYYEGKHPEATKSNWLMQEYKVNNSGAWAAQASSNNMTLYDWVLCKIYKKI